jgi:probable rRNA maturation factor
MARKPQSRSRRPIPGAGSRPTITIVNSQRAMRVPAARLRKLIAFVAATEGQRLAQVELTIVSAGEIAQLNGRFLGHAGDTDVLSFDLSDAAGAGPTGISCQLVVCGDVAQRQGRDRGTGPARELMLYVVHGLLHLMGYGDTTIRGGARMHAREDEILTAFGAGKVFKP